MHVWCNSASPADGSEVTAELSVQTVSNAYKRPRTAPGCLCFAGPSCGQVRHSMGAEQQLPVGNCLQVWRVWPSAEGRVRTAARPLQGCCVRTLAGWQLQRW
jgi:hypothetical protein